MVERNRPRFYAFSGNMPPARPLTYLRVTAFATDQINIKRLLAGEQLRQRFITGRAVRFDKQRQTAMTPGLSWRAAHTCANRQNMGVKPFPRRVDLPLKRQLGLHALKVLLDGQFGKAAALFRRSGFNAQRRNRVQIGREYAAPSIH